MWVLLALALALFVSLAVNDGIASDLHLRTAELPSFSRQEQKGPVKSVAGNPAANARKAAKPEKCEKAPLDTTAKNILLVGDSMLEGLGPRLAAYADENGHTLTRVIWYSSTSKVWGSSTRLKGFIDKFKPNYIFICLGANELFVADIKNKRDKYVTEILSQIGDIPFVWIGPPNWKKDTGINDLVRSKCPEGTFFYSGDGTYQRQKDGAHPTAKSAAAWMDRVCTWVMAESAHPILLNKPKASRSRCHTVILQPSDK